MTRGDLEVCLAAVECVNVSLVFPAESVMSISLLEPQFPLEETQMHLRERERGEKKDRERWRNVESYSEYD